MGEDFAWPHGRLSILRPGLGEGVWAREDLHLQGSQILDLWGLLFPLNHSPKKLEPPPGVAPS